MKATIRLIDLSGLAHPIWATLSSEIDPDARMRTGAQIVSRVHALAQGLDHVAICCDSGKSFRHDLEPTYKGNRPEKDAAFVAQVKQAQDVLKADGFPVWACPGFEADDVIATACFRARSAGHPVEIVSADKDLLALVTDADPAVTYVKVTDGTRFNADAVAQKLGVLPEQVTDLLTLMGDASDNIAGAKGIGPRKASELLNKFDTLDNVYDMLDKAPNSTGLTPSLISALRDFRPRMLATRALVRMRTDVPIANFDAVWSPRKAPEMDNNEPTFVDLLDGHDEPAPPEPPAKADPAEQVAREMQAARQAIVEAEPVASIPVFVPPPNGNGNGLHAAAELAQAKVQEQAGRLAVPTQALVPVNDAAQPPAEFERQLEPRSMGQAAQLAKMMFQSRLFSAYGNEHGVLATMLAGRELGMASMASLRSFHIIDGKPTMSADLIRALVMKSPKCEYFRCVERTAERATFVTKRRGDPEISLTFTVDEGRQAFGKDTSKWAASGWGKNPADMCVARASAKLARLVYPEIAMGLYDPSELES